ncbi:unnamed protein product [Colias eurytheme]|nr:unnamed protein product [Colias eurytheme]
MDRLQHLMNTITPRLVIVERKLSRIAPCPLPVLVLRTTPPRTSSGENGHISVKHLGIGSHYVQLSNMLLRDRNL